MTLRQPVEGISDKKFHTHWGWVSERQNQTLYGVWERGCLIWNTWSKSVFWNEWLGERVRHWKSGCTSLTQLDFCSTKKHSNSPHKHTRKRTHIHTHIHIHAHTHTHTYTHTRTYTHTHIYIHRELYWGWTSRFLMTLAQVSHVTHMNESCHTSE